jgi:predicted Zn-ribbon and HTH transcriptional regulator
MTCNQPILIHGTFPRPAKCDGILYEFGTGPDAVRKCPKCKCQWTLDGKEEV